MALPDEHPQEEKAHKSSHVAEKLESVMSSVFNLVDDFCMNYSDGFRRVCVKLKVMIETYGEVKNVFNFFHKVFHI